LIKVFIQVQAGARDRQIYNEKTLEYQGTRHGSLPYPFPYGFILSTSAEDGGNLDCYILTKDSLEPGTIVACEPTGLLEQYEDVEVDHKILASLPGQDMALDQNVIRELQDFIYAAFASYPEANIRLGPVLSREEALRHIQTHLDELD